MFYNHFKYTKYSCDIYGTVYGPRGKPIGSINPVHQYNTITVYDDKTKSVIQYRKHRFIMECYTGKPIPENMVVNHINGIKTDNNVSNLEIVTYKENTQHAHKLGLCTPKKGTLNGNCLISEETARAIIRLIIHTNKSNAEIAELYNVSAKHVSSIRHKRRWKHLYEEPEFSDYESSNSCFLNEAHFVKQVIIAYFCLNTNLSNRYLAKLFNVDNGTICRVRNKKLYLKAIEYCKQESSTAIESLMTPLELVEYNQAVGNGSINTTDNGIYMI